jgi:hypothetical protein
MPIHPRVTYRCKVGKKKNAKDEIGNILLKHVFISPQLSPKSGGR